MQYPTAGINGATMYAALWCTNQASLKTMKATADGVTVDQTPPSVMAERVRPGIWAAENALDGHLWQNVSTRTRVSWWQAWVDQEGIMHSVDVCLGSSKGKCDIAPSVRVDFRDRSWHDFMGLSMRHGTTVYVTQVGRNMAFPFGETRLELGTPLKIDLEPPILFEVSDGSPLMPGRAYEFAAKPAPGSPVNFKDVGYTSYRESFFFQASGDDADSGISCWSSMVQDAAGNVLADWDELPSGAAGARNLDSFMTHNTTYRLFLRARDRAGSWSPAMITSGILYDATPPQCSATLEGDYAMVSYNMTGGFTSRASFAGVETVPVLSWADPVFRVSFEVTDPESPLAECSYQVGSAPSGADVLPRTYISLAPDQKRVVLHINHSAAELGLLSGGAYWALVTCVNMANLPSYESTAPLAVDLLGPVIGTVRDTVNAANTMDTDYSPHLNRAAAAWPGAADAHVGMTGCWAALGNGTESESARTLFADWTAVGRANAIELDDLELTPNIKLFWSVKCVDAVENWAFAQSDGFVVDITPPYAAPPLGLAAVLDGTLEAVGALGVDLEYPDTDAWLDEDAFLCRFGFMRDDESGIQSYAVALGYSASPDAGFFTDLVWITSDTPYFAFEQLQLVQNSTVFCHVMAINNVGLNASFVSDGARVDFTVPECETAVVPASAVASVTALSRPSWAALMAADRWLGTLDSGVAIAFRCNDPETGIASVEVSLRYSDNEPLYETTLQPLPTLPAAEGGWPVGTLSLSRAVLTRTTPWRNANEVRFTLLVRNGAGGLLALDTHSFRLDATPPEAVNGWPFDRPIVDGPDAANVPLLYSSSPTSVSVTMYFDDPTSNVTLVELGVTAVKGTRSFPVGGINSVSNVEGGGSLSALNPSGQHSVPFFLVSKNSTAMETRTVQLPAAVATSATKGDLWHVFAIARAVNGLGQEVRWRTPGVLLDSTPPVCASFFGTGAYAVPLLDGLDAPLAGVVELRNRTTTSAIVQSLSGTLYGRWRCSETGAPLDRFEISAEVALNATAWESVCVPAVLAPTVTFGATSGCDVLHGFRYRLRVDAINKAGGVTTLRSPGVLIDQTPADIATVDLIPANPRGFIATTSWVAFNLTSVVDTETAVSSVAYRIVSSSELVARDWTHVTVTNGAVLGRVVNATGLVLTPGLNYDIFVRATNIHGLESVVSAESFQSDVTPVEVGTSVVSTIAYPEGFQSQPAYPVVMTSTTVTVTYENWRELESMIDAMQVVLVLACSANAAKAVRADRATLPPTRPLGSLANASALCRPGMLGSVVVGSATASAAAFSVKVDASYIVSGAYLVPVVFAANAVGMESGAVGAGKQVVLSVVSPGSVRDGLKLGVDVDGYSACNGAWANWDGFRDSAGGELTYVLGFGLTAGSASLSSWMPLKGFRPGNGSVVDQFAVTDGTTVYSTVRATSPQGSVATASSDGVVCDSSAPNLSFVGIGTRGHAVQLSPRWRIVVNWACSDLHSNISAVEVSLGSSAVDSSSLYGPVRLTSEGHQSIIARGILPTRVVARTGSPVIARVACVNAAGLRSTRFSALSWSDDTAPVVRNVLPGVSLSVSSAFPPVATRTVQQFLSRADVLHVSWDMIDLESGVRDSTVCIGSSVNATDILPCTSTGLAQAATILLNSAPCSALADPEQRRRRVCLTSAAALLKNGQDLFVTVTARSFASSLVTTLSTRAVADLVPLSNVSAKIVVVYRNASSGPAGVAQVFASDTAAFVWRTNTLDVMVSGLQAAFAFAPVETLTFSLRDVNGTEVSSPATANASQLEPVPGTFDSWLYTLHTNTNASMVQGASYNLSVVAASAGGTLAPMSAPFTVDNEPPVIWYVGVGSDLSMANTSSLSTGWGSLRNAGIVWRATDVGTGIAQTEARLCDADDDAKGCVTPWIKLPASIPGFTGTSVIASYVFGQGLLALTVGRSYFVQLRVLDRAGLSAVASSGAAVFDNRPPSAGAVLLPREGSITRPNSLVISFTPFSVPSGTIARYEICFLHTPAGKNIEKASLMPCFIVPPALLVRRWALFQGANVRTLRVSMARLLSVAYPDTPAFLIGRLFKTASNITIAIQATSTSGLRSAAYSGALVYDDTLPVVDPAYLANPGRYAEPKGISGSAKTLQRGGVMWARAITEPVAIRLPEPGTQPMSASAGADGDVLIVDIATPSATATPRPALASVIASNDLSDMRIAWVGIVDPETGLKDSAMLTVSRCWLHALEAPLANATNATNVTSIEGWEDEDVEPDFTPGMPNPSWICTPLVEGIPVSLAEDSFHLTGVPIEDGARYGAFLTVTNGAGASRTFATETMLRMDTQAPVIEAVSDGFPSGIELPGEWPARPIGSPHDATFWFDVASVAANWRATDESGIAEFRWAVCVATVTEVSFGSVPTADCPQVWTTAGRSTWAHNTLGSARLQEGRAYKSWLQAIDGAGNTAVDSSDAFVVSTRAPDARGHRVRVQPAVPSWGDIRVSLWNVTDVGSGIAQVQACLKIVESAGRDAVALAPCTPISLSLSDVPPFRDYLNESLAELADVAFESEWAARLEAAGGSYDKAMPLTIAIDFVVFNRAGLSVRFTSRSSVIVDAGEAALQGGIWTIEGDSWERAGFDGSVLPPLGQLARLPRATRNTTTLGFGWLLRQPKSGIAQVTYSLGTECGLGDITAPTRSSGDPSIVAFQGLDLAPNAFVYLTLAVQSGAGEVTTFCSANASEGLLVDVTTPYLANPRALLDLVSRDAATPAAEQQPSVVFKDASVVTVSWEGAFKDAASGLASYSLRVCEAEGLVCLTDWIAIDPPLSTSASLTHLSMRRGMTYRTHVRAFDAAGNFADSVSPGMVFDDSPPLPPAKVLVEPFYIPSLDRLSVEFEPWVDQQSGIREYQLQVQLLARNGSFMPLIPPMAFGNKTSYTASGDLLAALQDAFMLIDDGRRPAKLAVTVFGVNRVGMLTPAVGLVRLDDTPPIAGALAFESVDMVISRTMAITSRTVAAIAPPDAPADGERVAAATNGPTAAVAREVLHAEVDLSRPPRFQVSRRALAFAWRGFVDPESAADLAYPLTYVYGVGTEPGSDDVYRWTRFFAPTIEAVNTSFFKGILPGSDELRLHSVKLTSLDLSNGISVFVTVKAINAAGLETSVTSTALTIDATTPQSSHPQPLIDLQPAGNGSAVDSAAASALNAATNGTSASHDVASAGYGGFATRAGVADAQPLGDLADEDWSAAAGALSFAWRGWKDPQSYLDHVEFSVVELRADNGFGAEIIDASATAPPAVPLVLQASASAYSRLLAAVHESLAVHSDAAAARRLSANASNSTPAITAAAGSPFSFSNPAYLSSFGALVASNTSVALPAIGSLFEAIADLRTDLPLQPAFRGQMASSFLYWGGAPLTNFVAGAPGAGSGNVTVAGLPLVPGRMYGIALRAYSGSSQFTQVLSDGIRVDSPRSAPCFGRIQVGTAADRTDDLLVANILAGNITAGPRPAAKVDPSAAHSSTGTLPEDATSQPLVYVRFANKLGLTWHQYADPYVQRPSALQRLYVCPDVDGFGSGDLNSAYVAPGESASAGASGIMAPYVLPLAPTQVYAVRLQLAGAPNGTVEPLSPSSGRLLSARARVLSTSPASESSSGDVPLHQASPVFTGASDACCRKGLERVMPPSAPADIELLHPSQLTNLGRSIAVIASGGPLSARSLSQADRSYVVVASSEGALVMPTHHRSGALRSLNLSDIMPTAVPGALLGAATDVRVAASKVASGFTRSMYRRRVFPDRAPAFLVSTPQGLHVFEVHANTSITSVACHPPTCAPGTGFALEDSEAQAQGERMYLVASVTRALPAFAGYGFGRGVAVHNKTFAFAGVPPGAAGAAASVLSVCEDAFSPLAGFTKDSRGASANPYAWETLVCRQLSPPTEPQHATAGITGLPVPFLVAIDTVSFGTEVALAAATLAVAAPSTSSLVSSDAGAVSVDAILLYSAARAPPNAAASSAADRFLGQTSPLMSAILSAANASGSAVAPVGMQPRVLVDPTASDAMDGDQQTGFGTAIDLDAAGAVLLVAAPRASSARGRVYAYTLDLDTGAPELACYVEGGIPGFTRLGESLSALDTIGGDSADKTLALGVASLHAAHVVNGTATEVAASLVFSVRRYTDAATASAFQPALQGFTRNSLDDLGIPRCPVVALVATANAAVDLRVQLGLAPAHAADSANVTAALAALVSQSAAAHAHTQPVVAAAGSSLIVADARAPRWSQEVLVKISGAGASSVALELSRNATSPLLAPLAETGSGTVWHTALCPRDAVRVKSEAQFAVAPFVCSACPAGGASFGGLSSVCSTCAANSLCAGGVDATGKPTDTLVEVIDEGVTLQHGASYRVFVRGLSAAGRWLERKGPLIRVDVTNPLPPSSGVQDGRYVEGDTSCEGCNRDIAYTHVTDSLSVWHSGFSEDLSGIAYYLVGASTAPCDGLIRKRCENRTVHLSREDGVSVNVSTCSPLELEWRSNMSTRLRIPVELLGTPGFALPFDVDARASWDVAPLTNVGLNITHTFTGLRLASGTYAFGCAIAYNRAGGRTALSTNGFVVDTSPPLVVRGSVLDGLVEPDYDQQAMVDGLVANWRSQDYESGILQHAWAYTTDPSPVLDAYLAMDAANATLASVDWDGVQRSIATTLVHFESALSFSAMMAFDLQLAKGSVYYAAVRALNNAGLWGNIEVSDGTAAGKNEIKPDPAKPAAVGFNSVSSRDNYTSPEERRVAERTTVGTLAMPAGALGDRNTTAGGSSSGDGSGSASMPLASSIVAGVVDEDDIAGEGSVPGAVNASVVPPPAKNLRFGDYSFAIKAKDDSGDVIPGFRFAKPVIVSMLFSIPARLPSDVKFAPQLNLFNIERGAWEPAVMSCPPDQRFESIDYERQSYSCAICHLTQFGVFYQQLPVALLRAPMGGVLLANVSSMERVSDVDALFYASTGSASLPVVMWSLINGGSLPVLDASDSYDPDGFVRSITWTVTSAPPLTALADSYAAGNTTLEQYTSAVAALNAAVLQPLVESGSRAQVIPPANVGSGLWTFTATVADMDNATVAANLTLLFNLPPFVVFSRPYYTPESLAEEFSVAPAVVGSETSSAFTALAALATTDDVVIDASLSTDADDEIAAFDWSIDYALSVYDATHAIATIDVVNGSVALVRNVSQGMWVVALAVTDKWNASSRVTAAAGQGLIARITNGSFVATMDEAFVLDASATVSGSPVSQMLFAWSRTESDGAAVALPSGAGPWIRISNVTQPGLYNFSVLIVDPYGRSSQAAVSVLRHTAPVATVKATLPNATRLWCGPPFQVHLDASASYDPDGTAVSVAWTYAYAFAQVNGTTANDMFAPRDAAPVFTPEAPADGSGAVTVVRNRLSMGNYSFRALVTDEWGGRTVSEPPVTVSIGADGFVAVGEPVPADAVRPEYACTARPTPSATSSMTPTQSATASNTISSTSSKTSTRSISPSRTETPSTTGTGTGTSSMTPTQSSTGTSTPTATRSSSDTRTSSPTRTASPSGTGSASQSASGTGTATPTATRSRQSGSATPSASTTPLPPARPLTPGSVLALRIGPIFANTLVGAYVDELSGSHTTSNGDAMLLQSIRLPAAGAAACLFVPAAARSSGHGALVHQPQGDGFAVSCWAADGATPMVAFLSRNGSLTVTAASCGATCDAARQSLVEARVVEKQAAGGVVVETAIVPPLPVALRAATGDLSPSAAAQLAGARAAAYFPGGGIIFTRVDGVFFLAPSSDATPVAALAEGSFNSSDNLQPALLHVSSSGTLILVGKPSAGWLRAGHACGSGGGFGVYAFTPSSNPASAPAPWTCGARHSHMARSLFRQGRSISSGSGGAPGHVVLHAVTSSVVVRCELPAAATEGGGMTCAEIAEVGDAMGASFAYRGVAGVPLA